MDDKLIQQRLQADEDALHARKDSVMLRLLGYLLALVLGGAIVCFIIGLLKTTVDFLIIVGSVLLIVAIFIVWMYHSVKWHITEKRYRRLLNDYRARDGENTLTK